MSKEEIDVWEWYYHEGCLHGTDYGGREIVSDTIINRSDITHVAETERTTYHLRGPEGSRPRWWSLSW